MTTHLIKTRLTALTLCALLAATASADDTPQQAYLEHLQARIAQLEARVAKLEQQQTPPIILATPQPQWHVCRLKVFGRLYEAASDVEGEARHRARQACLRQETALFCTDRATQCESY